MKKILTDNLILKILSVFLAILIWIVVLNIEDPSKTRTISGIKVRVLNENVITSNNQVYTIDDGQIISVKVTGPRTVVDSLKASDFSATADFMDISQANSVPINVMLKEYTHQQKVTINSMSNTTIHLNIEDIVERLYDVKVKYMGTLPEGYIAEKTVLDTQAVTVTAPQSIHEGIKEVSISINLNDAKDDLQSVCAVRIINNSGADLAQVNENVFVDIPNVQAETTIYYTKNLALEYEEIEGIENDKMQITAVTLSKNQIPVKGRKEILDEVDTIYLPTGDIVIEEGQKETAHEYDIGDYLPEGVYLNEENNVIKLTVSIEEKVRKNIELAVSDIAIKNIPDGMDASMVSTGYVYLVVEGMEQVIGGLDEKQVIAFVSLKDLAEGISAVSVEMQLPEEVQMVNTAVVEVSLTSAESRQNPASIDEPSTSGQTGNPADTTTNANEQNTPAVNETTETNEDTTKQEET